MENLNKENFFNDLQQKFPKAMEHFCKWIDDYKQSVDWNELFRCDKYDQCLIKFRDIAYEMQVGILLRYMSEITEYPDPLTMEEIKETFAIGILYLQQELS